MTIRIGAIKCLRTFLNCIYRAEYIRGDSKVLPDYNRPWDPVLVKSRESRIYVHACTSRLFELSRIAVHRLYCRWERNRERKSLNHGTIVLRINYRVSRALWFINAPLAMDYVGKRTRPRGRSCVRLRGTNIIDVFLLQDYEAIFSPLFFLSLHRCYPGTLTLFSSFSVVSMENCAGRSSTYI